MTSCSSACNSLLIYIRYRNQVLIRNLIGNNLFEPPALPVPSPHAVLPDLTQHLWLEQIPAPRYLGLHCVCRIEVSGSPRVGDWQTGQWLDSRYLRSQSTFQRSGAFRLLWRYTTRIWLCACSYVSMLWCVLSSCWNFASSSRVCWKPVCCSCLLKSIVFHGVQATIVVIVIMIIIIIAVCFFVKAFIHVSSHRPIQ